MSIHMQRVPARICWKKSFCRVPGPSYVICCFDLHSVFHSFIVGLCKAVRWTKRCPHSHGFEHRREIRKRSSSDSCFSRKKTLLVFCISWLHVLRGTQGKTQMEEVNLVKYIKRDCQRFRTMFDKVPCAGLWSNWLEKNKSFNQSRFDSSNWCKVQIIRGHSRFV